MKAEITPSGGITTHDTLEVLAAIKKTCKKPGNYKVRCPDCQSWTKAWKSEIDDSYNLPKENRDDKDAYRDKLDAFRDEVSKSRLCTMWHEKSKLVSSVIVSLINVVDDFPRPGWTRGAIDNSDLLRQINEIRNERDSLLKENHELIKQNKYNLVTEDLDDIAETHRIEYVFLPKNKSLSVLSGFFLLKLE